MEAHPQEQEKISVDDPTGIDYLVLALDVASHPSSESSPEPNQFAELADQLLATVSRQNTIGERRHWDMNIVEADLCISALNQLRREARALHIVDEHRLSRFVETIVERTAQVRMADI